MPAAIIGEGTYPASRPPGGGRRAKLAGCQPPLAARESTLSPSTSDPTTPTEPAPAPRAGGPVRGGPRLAPWRRPLGKHADGGHELSVLSGLAALSLDALSSVAYGPEAMVLVLIAAGSRRAALRRCR